MTDIEYLQQSVTRGLQEILISEQGLTIAEALELLRTSRTFALVMDESTGLYRESPSYVYEYLAEEMHLLHANGTSLQDGSTTATPANEDGRMERP